MTRRSRDTEGLLRSGDEDQGAFGSPEHNAPLPAFAAQLDRALSIQRPVVLALLRQLRRRSPGASPAELAQQLERWYRRTAMTTGGGVGAAAAVPGVGTVTGFAILGVEVVGVLELSALYAMALAELHGEAVRDEERARALVMAIMMGERGKRLVQEAISRRRAPGTLMTSAFWGELIATQMPQAVVGELGARLRDQFLRRIGQRQLGRTVGKLVPFGVGAAIGAFGNRAFANEVISTAAGAFGPLPLHYPETLDNRAVQRSSEAADRRAIEGAVEKARKRAEKAERASRPKRITGKK